MAGGILAQLLANPHGYGAFPPAEVNQGEIRNLPDPYYGTGGPSLPAKLAYAISGIPMAIEGLTSAREGSLAGDPVRAAGGLGEAALAAVPAMGKAAEPLFATAPRLAALLAAGTAAPMAAEGALSPTPAEAGEAVDPLQSLYSDRARLTDEIAAATNRMNTEARTGKGPRFHDAEAELQRLTTQKAGLDQMIQAKEKENSPEHKQDLVQRQREIDEANAKAELDKPFQERHPNLSMALTMGAPVAAGAASMFGLRGIAAKGESLLADLLKAREIGDVPAMQQAAARLENWKRTAIPKQAAAIGVPATFPVDARVTGDMVDKYSLPPDSKAQNAAAERLGDLPQYAKDAVPALVSGLVYSGLGSKFAPHAPRGDAAAMGGLYGNKDAKSLADLLREGETASESVQGAIARSQTARQAREAASLEGAREGQQLDNAAGQVEGAARELKSPSLPNHHSALQPRNKKGQFKGPPKYPENDD